MAAVAVQPVHLSGHGVALPRPLVKLPHERSKLLLEVPFPAALVPRHQFVEMPETRRLRRLA